MRKAIKKKFVVGCRIQMSTLSDFNYNPRHFRRSSGDRLWYAITPSPPPHLGTWWVKCRHTAPTVLFFFVRNTSNRRTSACHLDLKLSGND